MKRKIINPWKWQDNFGYAQAVEIYNFEAMLYCAGQAAMNEEGYPVEGNMQEQLTLSIANLEKVILQAGYDPSNLVRLNIYTTAVAALFEVYETLGLWLKKYNCKPSSTLIEVKALAFPALKVEIEATVAK